MLAIGRADDQDAARRHETRDKLDKGLRAGAGGKRGGIVEAIGRRRGAAESGKKIAVRKPR